MKEIIMITALCCLCATVAGVAFKPEKEVIVDKMTVTYGEKFSEPEIKELKTEIQNKLVGEIPISVTLTKYQLEKMLFILEEENSYGRPADPQDSFTFTSIARGTKYSPEYSVSSTHLAKKPLSND